MSKLNEQQVAFLCRTRLGIADASQDIRFIAAIPEALKATARKIASDPFRRHLLITDRTDAILSIDEGKVYLEEAFSDFSMLFEYLDKGAIYHADSDFPLVLISKTRAALTHQFSTDFIYAFVEGNVLNVLGDVTGDLAFAVPFYPKNLDALPASEELHRLLIDKIIEIVNIDTDIAADGAH